MIRSNVPAKRIVVVGAGVAGLATAALLAHRGYRVTVLEKGDRPGGRAAQWTHEGFTFDLGPTLLFMPDVYRDLFASWGGDFDREVPLTRLVPNERLHFPDGRSIEVSAALPDTIASLERFAPGAGAGLLRYLAGAATAYELARAEFVGTRIRHWSAFVTPRKLAALVRSGAFASLRRVAAGAFGPAAAALSFQSMYLGMSPYASPALYRLLFYTEVGEGVFFPRGGIGAFVRALERAARANGATIVYDADVRIVERVGERVAAAATADERYPADAVVVTADLPYAYATLLGEPRHRSLRMRRTPSALLLYIALERRYDDQAHHEFLMPADLRATCADIFERRIFPRDPAIYLASPTATDPSFAPPGADALYVLVPTPDCGSTTDWERETPALADAILDRIEHRRLPGLRSRIRWMRQRTPADFARTLNLTGGSAFGLAHDLLQIGPLRPDNRHARYHNLYFAGASTRPATGLPLVALGAMQTAERIAEELSA